MKTSVGFKKILWAIDPFEEGETSHRQIAEFFRDLAERVPKLDVEPVALIGPGLLHPLFIEPRANIAWLPEMIAEAEARLAEIFLELQEFSFISPPRLLAQSADRIEEAVDLLLSEADDLNTDVIFVHAHEHGSLERLFKGSFTETLLLKAKLPVLAWGGNVQEARPLNRILFPTDFGEQSKGAFRKVVQIADTLGSELILFHAFRSPSLPGVDLEGASHLFDFDKNELGLPQIVERQWDHQSRRAAAWAQWSEEAGVPTEVVLEESGGDVDHLIVEYSRRLKADLVFMEGPQKRSSQAYLLGSHALHTLRTIPCPLYLLTTDHIELDHRHEHDQASPV